MLCITFSKSKAYPGAETAWLMAMTEQKWKLPDLRRKQNSEFNVLRSRQLMIVIEE